jgi:hypothetical protein
MKPIEEYLNLAGVKSVMIKEERNGAIAAVEKRFHSMLSILSQVQFFGYFIVGLICYIYSFYYL